jgi:hypothetical protein
MTTILKNPIISTTEQTQVEYLTLRATINSSGSVYRAKRNPPRNKSVCNTKTKPYQSSLKFHG